jgi:YVTN family beta-propeller protein
VGERPYGVTFSKGRAFVTNQYANTLSVIDLATLIPVATIETNEYPEGIDTTADGRVIFSNWFDNTIQVMDPDTLEITDSFDTADGPRAFGRFIADH